MSDALSKIENFLFDILGLVLPGLIFLSFLFLPITVIEIDKIPIEKVDNSFILSELSTMSKLIKTYWASNSSLLVIIVFVVSYLIGHFVKVFAIMKYEILTAIFDKSINPLFNALFKYIKTFVNWAFKKSTSRDLFSTKFYKWVKDFCSPIKSIFNKIFVFKPPEYFSDNESLKTNCVSLINSRLNTQYPDKWYSVYKFSMVITNQENIKSLSSTFLAKYNLYRSLAFIFMFMTAYYYFFFSASITYIPQDFKKITSLILLACTLLWFTFHYKYKRYWTLCGNETLVSLFYFLNKKKVNEQ